MSELRQDRISGRWVIIAPQRGRRPNARHVMQRQPRAHAPFDPSCPFCPGHEDRLPAIVSEIAIEATPHWAVRVVPNKYPALRPDAKAAGLPGDGQRILDGHGWHEVIIESPRHDADLASMSDAEVEAAVLTYRDRSRHFLTQPGIQCVSVFRNHGERGGASLAHPHAQVIAVGIVPAALGQLEQYGRAYQNTHGRCATCDEIDVECGAAVRLIEETTHFAAMVPFAATAPSEICIVPKRHQASFSVLEEPNLREFAQLLKRTLERLRRVHDDPPYNFTIESATRASRDATYMHWRLRIMPSLVTAGGFELGTGMAINPSLPEEDAAALRTAI
jgi:UDPglucose--hexose-1-phosphate uridylyltransferase